MANLSCVCATELALFSVKLVASAYPPHYRMDGTVEDGFSVPVRQCRGYIYLLFISMYVDADLGVSVTQVRRNELDDRCARLLRKNYECHCRTVGRVDLHAYVTLEFSHRS